MFSNLEIQSLWKIETSDVRTDENHDFPPKLHNTANLVPVPELVQHDLSLGPQSQIPVLSQESRIEEPAKTPVAKRYPARVRALLNAAGILFSLAFLAVAISRFLLWTISYGISCYVL